ncbi:hypothetical protein AB4071_02925 [Stenotrophomonas sp. 2MCAF14_2]|uniref:hypothetical protein n=1 Tax=Stenotrophomonas sp. 2MCAF14_2 TaxID=3232983 RepID=UPI003F975358
MSSKHTPGPWAYQEDSDAYTHIVRGPNNRFICQLNQSTSAEIEANARLIAAAPELLEACQTFAEWLRREEGVGDLEAPWRGKRDTPEGEAAWREWYYENLRLCGLAQEQARAAIAKATGAIGAQQRTQPSNHPPCPGCFDTECNGECMENL